MKSSAFVDKTQIPITVLVLPMFVENIIRTSMLSVDQLMLYAYSEKAVAALGVVNQMAFFVQIVYTMVAVGASIPIAQNLGAGNRREAGLYGLASFSLIGALAAIMSCLVVVLAGPVLSLYPLEADVRLYAWQFLAIYGAGSVFIALNLLQSNILRAYGFSKDPMATNILALLLTIVGNYLCLFGPFGFPVLGVAGVACSNVFSQFVAFWIMGWQIRRRKDIGLPWKSFFRVPARIYKKILEIGVPTAGENLSYNVGQILIGRIVAQMGTSALAAYTLVLTLSRYVFISGVSIGAGTQIKVGYFVGAERAAEAYRKVYKYTAVGVGISLAMVVLINLVKVPLLQVFTQNPAILGMASATLVVALVLEPVRAINCIVIPGLKGAGDVRFPVYMGMIFMWGVGVCGALTLGVGLGLGLVGVWIAMTCDESARSVLMLLRWRGGAWKRKGLITPQGAKSQGEVD